MDEVSNKNTFSKQEKLKGKKNFEILFTKGKRIKVYPVQLCYHSMGFKDGSPLKVAVVAPKKKFKKAIQRNRVKRLLRESYRLNKSLVFNNIEGNFALLFVYLGHTVPTFVQVESAMSQLLKKFIEQQSHEKNS